MRDLRDSEAPEPNAARMQVHAAYLVRALSDNRRQQFILEEVATRKRRQFDDLQALLVYLREVLAAGST